MLTKIRGGKWQGAGQIKIKVLRYDNKHIKNRKFFHRKKLLKIIFLC